MTTKQIAAADIMPMADYGKIRKQRRQDMAALKKNRRLSVGPDTTFHFECYETMLHQVHEMLYIERGGAEQLVEELAAYNPLVPNGRELVATFMIEIEDEGRRRKTLAVLGGIERTVTLDFEGETVKAVPEADTERTNAAGKAAAVHFLHFPFTAAQIAKFKKPGIRVLLGIGHREYAHMAILPDAMREALAKDFN